MSTVLVGGKGRHLFPLTEDRIKSAVPFGGSYRLVDFVLSNLTDAGLSKICMLTRYKSHSLDRHISQAWQLFSITGQYAIPMPTQQRLGKRRFTGSVGAILQSLGLVYDEDPEYVIVSDIGHVYRVDPQQMLEVHIESGAGVTVAGTHVPHSETSAFGIADADDNSRITKFPEKPVDPPGTSDGPGSTFTSMGNYISTTLTLIDAIKRDSGDEDSDHGMGENIIPMLVEEGEVFVWNFRDSYVPDETERDKGYWRDVGIINAFHEANIDLIFVHPVFNLYNKRWPIHTFLEENLPLAKSAQGGIAQASMVGAGSIVSGGIVRNSVISTNAVVEDDATVEGLIFFPGVRVGRGIVVRHVTLDKNVVVSDGTIIDVDLEKGAACFKVSVGGATAAGKGQVIQAG